LVVEEIRRARRKTEVSQFIPIRMLLA